MVSQGAIGCIRLRSRSESLGQRCAKNSAYSLQAPAAAAHQRSFQNGTMSVRKLGTTGAYQAVLKCVTRTYAPGIYYFTCTYHTRYHGSDALGQDLPRLPRTASGATPRYNFTRSKQQGLRQLCLLRHRQLFPSLRLHPFLRPAPPRRRDPRTLRKRETLPP